MLEENRKIHTRMNTDEDIMLLSYFLVSNCIMVEEGSYQDIFKWGGWGGWDRVFLVHSLIIIK